MTGDLIKQEILGQRHAYREKAIRTLRQPSTSQGEGPGTDPCLTALRRNHLASP